MLLNLVKNVKIVLLSIIKEDIFDIVEIRGGY